MASFLPSKYNKLLFQEPKNGAEESFNNIVWDTYNYNRTKWYVGRILDTLERTRKAIVDLGNTSRSSLSPSRTDDFEPKFLLDNMSPPAPPCPSFSPLPPSDLDNFDGPAVSAPPPDDEFPTRVPLPNKCECHSEEDLYVSLNLIIKRQEQHVIKDGNVFVLDKQYGYWSYDSGNHSGEPYIFGTDGKFRPVYEHHVPPRPDQAAPPPNARVGVKVNDDMCTVSYPIKLVSLLD